MVSGNPFVGRDTELRRLGAALEGTLAGRGRLVRIVGEPGIGKTRLADALAEVAAERGFVVAWGRCWEAGGAPSFWPWAQVERALGEGDRAPELSLSRAPTVVEATAGTASAADAEQTRFRVFDAVSQRLFRASAASPLLVVIDDAHAADVPSLHLLRFVARGLRSARVMIAVTHREVEPRLRPEVGDLLGRIARDGETITLGRLHETDIGEWLRNVGRPDSAAARVHRATEGNPLFVQELLELPSSDEWRVGASDTVRVAIAEHLSRLSEGTRTLLEIAAVLGREAARADLVKLAEAVAGPPDVEAALREAINLGVVEARGADRVAFRHILLRDDLYESLSAARRALVHGRAAEMLDQRARLGDEAALAQAAHHEIEAARTGTDIARAMKSVRHAAARAVAHVAYEQAAELLQSAVALLEARGTLEDADAVALLIELGEALMLSGLGSRGREVCARAAALAKALGAKPLVVRAALVYGSELLTGQRDEKMLSLLRDAMDAVGEEPTALRARVMARLAGALLPAPADDREPNALARDAIAMARASGDRLALLQTLQFAIGVLVFRDGKVDRRALTEETLALALDLDRPAIAAMAFPWAIALAYDTGDVQGAERHIAGLSALTQRMPPRMPQPNYRIRVPIVRAMRASLIGAWAEIDLAFAEVRTLVENSETPPLPLHIAAASLCHHFARGDAARLEADVPFMKATYDTFPAGRVFMGLCAAMRARAGTIPFPEARAALAGVREHLASVRVAVHPAAGPAAWAAVLLEDRELVENLHDVVLDRMRSGWGMIFIAGCAGTLGPTSLVLADMCALLGRHEEALRHYDEATAFAEKIGATLWVERTKEHRAKLGAVSLAPPRSTPASRAAPPSIALEKEGEMWTLRAGHETWHLKASKGLSYLATLLAHPHEELHVAQLVGAAEEATGDAGPMLDKTAKEAYRRRAGDLRALLDEAVAHGDVGREARAREELDALGEELARAVGLGGRDRKAASDVERMRVNVQRRLKDAIDRVRAQSPAIGRYLDASVRTGSFCSYAPAWTGKD